jgi:hypothetical protein
MDQAPTSASHLRDRCCQLGCEPSDSLNGKLPDVGLQRLTSCGSFGVPHSGPPPHGPGIVVGKTKSIAHTYATNMNERNMMICIWCRNQNNEACIERCQSEGKYRNLEPEPLAQWEFPPELPAFRELLDLPPHERLALIYLDAYYRASRERG